MRDINVIVVGDSMLDRYYEGAVNRISPEAPCPIVDVATYLELPGGAANVAMNLAALDVPCTLITVLGGQDNDEGAAGLRHWFEQEERVTPHVYHLKNFRTPIKTRICSGNGQQLLRLDQQDIRPFSDAAAINAIWHRYEALVHKAGRGKKPSVVILSDYGKGVLRDSDLVRGMLDLAQILKIPTIIDPKDRNLARYTPATIIKPNLREAQDASGGDTADDCAERIMKELHPALQCAVVTDGINGMVLATHDEREVNLEAVPAYPPRPLVNSVGAGDTVTAVLAMHMACMPDEYDDVKFNFRQALKAASIAAGVVVNKPGTATIKQWEFEAALSEYHMLPPTKYGNLDVAQTVVEHAHDNGEEVVLANGCFDQLHPGHLHLLQEARRRGDLLVVAVNSDESVRRLKGPSRPLIKQDQRIQMLEALDCVDLVVVFDEDTPEKLIRQLKPDLLAKGHEYYTDDLSTVPGAKFIIENGGGIVFVKMLEGYSTTTQAIKARDVFKDD
jgi:D-beta-D-heptose 7-phosphate kinase/D-beta-D-heptose 1-phosphate adenosyltransferase